jgi:hypothetical protein
MGNINGNFTKLFLQLCTFSLSGDWVSDFRWIEITKNDNFVFILTTEI